MRILILALLALGSGCTHSFRHSPPKPLRVLLVCGGCCHDYSTQKEILKQGIEARAHVVIDTIQQGGDSRESKIPLYENPDWAKGYDAVIHDDCFGAVTDVPWIQTIVRPHQQGIPGVNLHCAMHSYRMAPGDDWQRYTGIRSMKHGPRKPIEVKTVASNHPITQGLSWQAWLTHDDELYNNVRVFENTTPLQMGNQLGEEAIVTWVNEYKNRGRSTRVFSTTLGHGNDVVSDPKYLELVTRGLLWSCNQLNAKYSRSLPKQ